eukprot:1432705-Amphidinium_carterae.1
MGQQGDGHLAPYICFLKEESQRSNALQCFRHTCAKVITSDTSGSSKDNSCVTAFAKRLPKPLHNVGLVCERKTLSGAFRNLENAFFRRKEAAKLDKLNSESEAD